ncbi:undecaprenyl-phosphate glucose phosphotransferase [Aureimonas sp. ME7]|uniref:undecaprenyl-phosphate glucose phosphotransferase n=1 Tax=Aureimonas sp. ME7 TaxID=2744252 RepID=UPI0015FB81F7|nr:undecaprenyl-phosphate glucose phosphotransferase [Aureimonas sp. ME7]
MIADQSEHTTLAREAIRTFQGVGGAPAPISIDLNAAARRAASQFSGHVLSPRLLSGLSGLAEFAILVTFLTGMRYALHAYVDVAHPVVSTVGFALGTVSIVSLLHGYEASQLRSQRRQSRRLALGLSGGAALSAALAFALGSFSLPDQMTWLAISGVVSFLLLSLVRSLLAARVRHWARTGRLERRIVLVGGGRAAEEFIRTLEKQPDSDIRICGIFDDREDDRSPPIVAGYPKLGTIAELTEFARLARIDMLVITLPLSAERRILAILKALWVLPLDIRISALSQNLRFRSRSYSYAGDVPMLDVIDRPIADWSRVAKRVFDLAFGVVALAAVSPIMLLTALAIKWDTPGPIFFRQKRHGFNNEIIDVWKFRSLRHEMSDPSARKLVTRDDPRVTRVGKFIRRTSIDELPQLFNVLAGNLSMVGPRPHAVAAQSSRQVTFTEIVDGYFGRHKVKPGITGYAQIKGWRGEIDDDIKLQKRFEHDLFYIENWSVLLDLYILAATPLSLVTTRNAY